MTNLDPDVVAESLADDVLMGDATVIGNKVYRRNEAWRDLRPGDYCRRCLRTDTELIARADGHGRRTECADPNDCPGCDK